MVKATEITVEELRRGLSEFVQRASFGKERFVLTFHGKATCALVPLEDLEATGGKVAAPRRSKADRK